MVIASKVARTLRQRYVECKASSNVFNKPHPKMALYGYSISTMSKVMYFVRGGGGECKRKQIVLVHQQARFICRQSRRGASSVLSTTSCCDPFFRRSIGREFLLSCHCRQDFCHIPLVDVSSDHHSIDVREQR
jgi:hypothetical protein